MVFDHDDYRKYLQEALALSSKPGGKSGERARLARYLKCQTSFISQVLNGRSHFSLEHAMRVSDFLGHSTEDRHFFMLLVQCERAGSRALTRYYRQQIEELRKVRQLIKERIKVEDELPFQDQITYYSAWWYAAVHILCAFPETQTRAQIARKLSLPEDLVERIIVFLLEKGLVKEEKGRYQIHSTRIHLGPNSPLLPRHHANWRMKAMQTVDNTRAGDLHYSAVIGISRKDAQELRSLQLELLQKAEKILRESAEEAAYVVLMDLFEL